MWGVAFWILAIKAYTNNKIKVFCVFIILGAMVREDMLGYYGLSFLGFYLANKHKKELTLAILFIFSSISLLALKTLFFPGVSLLKQDFIGDPPFKHISLNFIDYRISVFPQSTWIIILSYFLLIILSYLTESKKALWSLLVFIPWGIFSFFAIMESAGTFNTYFGFPALIAMFNAFINIMNDDHNRIEFRKKKICILIVVSILFLSSNLSANGLQRFSSAVNYRFSERNIEKLELDLKNLSRIEEVYVDPSLVAVNPTLWRENQIMRDIEGPLEKCLVVSGTSTFSGRYLIDAASKYDIQPIKISSELFLISQSKCPKVVQVFEK
jgi:hypothetical protein